MERKRRVIVWFRQDIRLHDNEALQDALRQGDEVIPVFVFDDRLFSGQTASYGFRRIGKFRAQFIVESVQNLQASLRALNAELIIRIGKPEEELFKIARATKSTWIFCNRDRTPHEVAVQDVLEQKLWSIGQELRYSRGKMLYYTADLPFPVTHTPNTFTLFRKEVEKYIEIRVPLAPPSTNFTPLSTKIDPGKLPTLETLGYTNRLNDTAKKVFTGGETEGLSQLQQFKISSSFHQYPRYKEHIDGITHTSLFSAWLSQGCLSPKYIYYELKENLADKSLKKAFNIFFIELIRRDFFRLIGKKYGHLIFDKNGITGKDDKVWKEDILLFNQWKEGKTGIPIIDACMRALQETGYLSHRGRWLVADFLVNKLELNWQMGAEYFESILIDYDVFTNWINWLTIAGLGTEAKETREINVYSQSKICAPKGIFIKKWIPELATLTSSQIHAPFKMSLGEQKVTHCIIGKDYPEPMIATGFVL